MPGTRPTVMIVDDDPQVRTLYAEILATAYDPLTAESGDAALEAIDASVDVVLLDRRMPGLSGGDVLRRLREAGYEMPVAMVTAVEPDFDIIEMGFDDYITKPVPADELRELVDTLLLRLEYDAVIREYFALVSKVTALQLQKSADELESNPVYAEAAAELAAIRDRAHAALDMAMENGTFEELFHDLEPLEADHGVEAGVSALTGEPTVEGD